MGEIFDYAGQLKAQPDLLPWVVFIAACVLVGTNYKRILAYFDARIEATRAREKSDAVMAELVRNNTAALQNNTEMLSILRQERHEMAALLESHEQMSMERVAHLQTVINRCDENVSRNNKNIEILIDRTK